MAGIDPPLPEDRMLVEQLRLQLGNVGSSVIPTLLVAPTLVFVLANPSNGFALGAWCAAIIIFKLFLAWDARRLLETTITPVAARSVLGRKMVLNLIDGALWGALAWAALGSTTVAGSVLVVATLAGVAGSSMSSLAPIFPLFVVFGLSEAAMLSSKLWTMDDPAYRTLAVAVLLYIAALIGQARNGARAARRAIALGLENVGLVERLRVESEHAQQAHRTAEEANLAKSRFLAAASHDLRQPIHAQGLFLEVLARTPLTIEQKAALANARATWQASAEMLDTLLDFSRLEAGVVKPVFQAFALQPLLNRIENELAPLADAKGIVYRSRETRAVVKGDPALVALILRNLVSNAIRYTDDGGVLVACRTRGGSVSLEVWDTGVGIEAAHHQTIFREFHQLGNVERDRRKGLGLGLAIAQGLARALGQELRLSSVAGRGSVFRFRLPLARAGMPMAPAVPDKPAAQRSFDGMRVLVIDDDETVRTAMQQLLRAWGCRCDVADSIEEVLIFGTGHRPDLAIVDYRLRGHSTGADAVATLRREFGGDMPALLVTGDTAPERLREAMATGVPLLHKPVLPGELHRAMSDLLAGRMPDASASTLDVRAPAV
ncbi:hybrid sensor histidine kinase/response regulator [Variovorax dokdonensis]|uniref:histidine kinase n=1 Tax=Variovorax dokdonensis TaxID=344883 RepID=A0ABT7NDN1_9BURK|nr:hybrid sensor histidine kinase/response regulator [Variovorax dokdonensis]MDM0045935.1 hybrid sensor histidine kinase/response regulator [Variovorax dokdonensis]